MDHINSANAVLDERRLGVVLAKGLDVRL